MGVLKMRDGLDVLPSSQLGGNVFLDDMMFNCYV